MGASLDLLVPELRDAAHALLNAASAAGLQPRVTSTLRSNAEQKRLYSRFLATQGQGGFPVAPPGASSHEYGEAFDMVVSPLDALADVGYTWQTWGGGWNPGDAVHFELPGASDRARKRSQNVVKSFSEWLDQFYNGIPWWVQIFFPMWSMIKDEPLSHDEVVKRLKSWGLF